MRVKLVGKGYEKFTGMFGAVKFEGGVSEVVSLPQANALAAVTRCEILEGDESKIVNRVYEANKHTPAPSRPTHAPAEKQAEQAKPAAQFTKESLETIADEGGIQGLRDIAEKFGVRSTSIKGLIEAILQAQEV